MFTGSRCTMGFAVDASVFVTANTHRARGDGDAESPACCPASVSSRAEIVAAKSTVVDGGVFGAHQNFHHGFLAG